MNCLKKPCPSTEGKDQAWIESAIVADSFVFLNRFADLITLCTPILFGQLLFEILGLRNAPFAQNRQLQDVAQSFPDGLRRDGTKMANIQNLAGLALKLDLFTDAFQPTGTGRVDHRQQQQQPCGTVGEWPSGSLMFSSSLSGLCRRVERQTQIAALAVAAISHSAVLQRLKRQKTLERVCGVRGDGSLRQFDHCLHSIRHPPAGERQNCTGARF